MAAYYLSTSQGLNTSSESLSSNSSTSNNSFTRSSGEEEEDGLRYKNNLDDSDEGESCQCYSGTMATWHVRIRLSTSQKLNTPSESLSSNSSTLDNSFAYSSEEEDGLSDSDKCECDQCLSGAYRISACGKRKVCMFISSLKNEITDLQESKKHLQADLIKKDREINDKNAVIDTLETQCKRVSEELEQERNTNDKRRPELEEKLKEKDRDIIEKNKVIAALGNQCKLTLELEEIQNKKDKDIKAKNNAIAALEKQCKMESDKLEQICKRSNERIQELEEILNEKEKDIKKKSNAIEDLEKQCEMESQKLEEMYKANNERIQKLEEKLCKKDREITAKNQAIATLESQCKINEKEVMKITTQHNFETMQNKKVQGEQASEIKRLQKYEEIHPAIQAKLVDLQKKLDNYQATLANANDKIKQLTNELRTAGKEKDELLHRLSKIAGAKLTYNNPNIADLSDQKRPTKLAEEFAELYDNEWTDAFEDVDIESDEDKVAYMLSLLKTAYELCKKASQNHMEKMRSSICKLTLGAKQTSGEKNKTSKTKCGEVVFDYEKFQDEQKKAVMDLGKFVEIKLSTEFEKIVVDDIASEYCIDKNNRKKLYVYTQKCVNICWSMCRLEIPVAIGLQEVYDRMPLDTSVFKAYTKSGKFVDYIVWPPLYLHENGPLLCKGVAQGKA